MTTGGPAAVACSSAQRGVPPPARSSHHAARPRSAVASILVVLATTVLLAAPASGLGVRTRSSRSRLRHGVVRPLALLQEEPASAAAGNATDAAQVAVAGLLDTIKVLEPQCEKARGFLLNATADFNTTRDDIVENMNAATAAVREAREATVAAAAKGTADEADVLESLKSSQVNAATARSLRARLEALNAVRKDAVSTSGEVCGRLQAAKDKLHTLREDLFRSAHEAYEMAQTKLEEAKRSLRKLLTQAREDSAAAKAAQLEGVLPGPVVTQKLLVVERSISAAKTAKQLVEALTKRVDMLETDANDKHIALAGEPMEEVKARMAEAEATKESKIPPAWSTPELQMLNRRYSEAAEAATAARATVDQLHEQLKVEGLDEPDEPNKASASGASGSAAPQADSAAQTNALELDASRMRFREEPAGEAAAPKPEAAPTDAGAEAPVPANASEATGNSTGNTTASEPAAASGPAAVADASGSEGTVAPQPEAAASGPAEEPAPAQAAGKGPAHIVTHMMNQDGKTVVTTTTFHNAKSGESPATPLWKKVKSIEERDCPDCPSTSGGASGPAENVPNQNSTAKQEEQKQQQQQQPGDDFNARLSSMENALYGALAQKQSAKAGDARLIEQLQQRIEQLEKQVQAAQANNTKDPVAVLRTIHTLATSHGGAGNVTSKSAAATLRAATSSVLSPEDADALDAVASKLEEPKAAGVTASGSGPASPASEATGSSGPADEPSELASIAEKLANLVSGDVMGPAAQDADRPDTAAAAEDLDALKSIASKLTKLAAGAEKSDDSADGSDEEQDTSADDEDSAAESDEAKIAEATAVLGEESKSEATDAGAAKATSEAQTDDELEMRIAALEKQLSGLGAAASSIAGGADAGASAEAGEGTAEEAEEVQPGADAGGADAGGADAEGADAGGADAGGASGEAPAQESGADGGSAASDSAGTGAKTLQPSAANNKGFKPAVMVERNTLPSEEPETEGAPMQVPTKTDGAAAAPCGPGDDGCEPPQSTGGQTESPEIVSKISKEPLPQGKVVATNK